MSNELPTLQEVARRTLWIEGVGLSDHEISDALAEAGIDPANQNERERFLHLVKANFHYQRGEIAAVLGLYFDRAREELGRDAPQDEVLRRAVELAHRDEPAQEDEKTNPD